MGNSTYDLEELLSSPDRQYYVVNNSDDEVEIKSLKGKTVGLYFSAAWSGPCKRFTPILIESYNEIVSSAINGDFEIVFVSADEEEECFEDSFSKMPWVAIPFFDSETRSRLDEVFKVRGLPHLTILDQTGKVLLNDHAGCDMVKEYGSDAYPFTQQRLLHLRKLDDEAANTKHYLISTLLSRSPLSAHANQVPVTVSDLQGKIVGLYFSLFSFKACMEFTPKLVQVYEKLKANGESFEIVMIPLDDMDEEELLEECFKNIPWLSLPLNDRISRKLVRVFHVSELPTLVIFGEDGRFRHLNARYAIEEYGVEAFPFTRKKLHELTEQEEEAQTLESILVSGSQDFAIKNDGAKIGVGSLVGKNIVLYFSAYWSIPCRGFNVELMETYKSIKEKEGEGMEVVFITSDRDEATFKDFFAGMPWLALPFGDSRVASLKRKFSVGPYEMPMLVAIGPDGRTVAENAKDLIECFGVEVYPFTNERVKEVGERWPETLKHKLHEQHQLMRVWHGAHGFYTCNHCFYRGLFLSFRCAICDFDLHPKCAFA